MASHPPTSELSKWSSLEVIRLLGSIGALGGIVAVFLVLPYQVNSFFPGSSLLSPEIWQNRGVRFMALMLGLFLLSGLCVALTFIAKNSKLLAGVIILLGIILLSISTASMASVGGYAFYPAICVLASGILFFLAARENR